MDEIKATKQAELQVALAEEKAKAAANVENKPEQPLHKLRLKMLKRDIRHVISHTQRMKILEFAKKEKERKEKEEAERKKKEEE